MKLILIGDVPRTGKTTLAKKIANDLSISWISTDSLESIAHSYTPTEQQDVRFPKSVMRRNTNRNNDEFYATYSISEIIDSYETQAKTVSDAIEALARYAVKEGWGYVIEGYHVTPQLLVRLRDQGINLSSIILVNTDPQEAIDRSRQSNVKNDWVRDNTYNEETYVKICDGIKEHSQRLIQQSQEFGIECVNMAEDFKLRLKKYTDYLLSKDRNINTFIVYLFKIVRTSLNRDCPLIGSFVSLCSQKSTMSLAKVPRTFSLYDDAQ